MTSDFLSIGVSDGERFVEHRLSVDALVGSAVDRGVTGCR
jgi:hypothetical protein